MDDKTKEALLGSIAKWEAIVAGHGEDAGPENCPLCQMFWGNTCDGCPVKDKTGQVHCAGSPYDGWCEFGYSDMSINEAPEDEQEDLKQLAQTELDFLISLLPPED